MRVINYEFKARLRDEKRVREVLKRLRARYVGTDHQADTYFRVPVGRLKLRAGRIENALIFYRRANARRPRRAGIFIMLLPRRNAAKAVLAAALGVLAVVEKRREIYFVGNVKIHLDRVRGFGSFVEVEAIRRPGASVRSSARQDARIRAQAKKFQRLLGIARSDIVPESYSDLVLRKRRR